MIFLKKLIYALWRSFRSEVLFIQIHISKGVWNYLIFRGVYIFLNLISNFRKLKLTKFGIAFVVILQLYTVVTFAASFNDSNQGDFIGSHFNTQWNGVDGVEMNAGGLSTGSGTYTSEIKDTGGSTQWQNLSWLPKAPYGKELPNNGLSELDYLDSLALDMSFNEPKNSTVFADSSGNGLDATCLTTCPTADVSGIFNKSARFNDSILAVPNSNFINTGGPYTDRTINLWITPNALKSNERTLIYEEGGTDRGFSIYIDDRVLYAGAYNILEYGWNGSWLTYPVSNNNDYFISLRLANGTDTVEANKLKLFINGVEVGSAPGGKVYSHGGGIGIGGVNGFTLTHDGQTASPYRGKIDELKIYNEALTISQINELYTANFIDLSLYPESNIDMVENQMLFHFNENLGASNFINTSGLNSDASCTNCPLSGQEGVLNEALRFTVDTDFLSVPNSININQGGPYPNRTIFFWFKADTTTGKRIIYEEGGPSRGFNAYIDNGNLVVGGYNKLEYNWPGTWLSTPINTNQWYHAAMVLSNGTDVVEPNKLSLYLNGQLVSSGSGGQVYTHSDDIRFGSTNSTLLADGSTSANSFLGYLDEFALFNRAWSAASIRDAFIRGASNLKFQLRICDNPTCTSAVFGGPTGSLSYYTDGVDLVSASHDLSNLPSSRYIQYRATFESINPSINFNPTLLNVNIEYALEAPHIAFNIRTADDTANTNRCYFGEVDDQVFGTCSYRLKISTNASAGYSVFVETDGGLFNGENFIQNANDGLAGGSDISLSTIGNENYGVHITPGSLTSTGSINLQPLFAGGGNAVLYNYLSSQKILEATGPNAPAATDLSNTSLIEHRLTVSGSTPPGLYQQNVIYTVIPNF